MDKIRDKEVVVFKELYLSSVYFVGFFNFEKGFLGFRLYGCL